MATLAVTAPAPGTDSGRARIAKALAERARRRRAADPLAALTPRQREIAVLVASGLDNRRIARALWVTRRTVEFHLTNVYRALGVEGRVELAALLGTAPGDRRPA